MEQFRFENVASLSKENFWNKIEELYPKAFAEFSAYIDEYKKSVNWEKLFNGGIHHSPEQGFHEETRAPKFHELPFEMQTGVVNQFLIGRINEEHNPVDVPKITLFANLARGAFDAIEKKIVNGRPLQ